MYVCSKTKPYIASIQKMLGKNLQTQVVGTNFLLPRSWTSVIMKKLFSCSIHSGVLYTCMSI